MTAAALDDHRRRVKRVMLHVDRCMHRPCRLAELAAEACYAPFHFSRVFTSLMGESPHQCVYRKRMERAGFLLLTSRQRVIDIALEVGYETASAFCKGFTGYAGQSPRRFRDAASREWYLKTNRPFRPVAAGHRAPGTGRLPVVRALPPLTVAYRRNDRIVDGSFLTTGAESFGRLRADLVDHDLDGAVRAWVGVYPYRFFQLADGAATSYTGAVIAAVTLPLSKEVAMNADLPSMTATIMAFHRALEMTLPEAQRVCHDPLAAAFLPPEWARLLGDRERLTALITEKARRFPGVNGAVVARLRFIDDVLAGMLADGLQQLVILGAGYDSRAYRCEGIQGRVSVFELDDPATQADKRAKLEAALGRLPGHVRFIALDFTAASIRRPLPAAGFDSGKRSLFVLEGLVPYISRDTFGDVLAFIAGQAARNGVVFDYLPPSVVDGTCPWEEGRNMYREVIDHGETFRLGFDSARLPAFLAARGFSVLQNVNAPDLRGRYFRGAGARRPVTPVFWFVHAVTGGGA